MNKVKYLPIITRDESCKLDINDICYVYRVNRKLQFETDYGVKYVYAKIDDIEKYLGSDFFRCMSGCIVNIARIIDMKRAVVYFDNGKSIRMGRETYIKVKQKFNAYMLQLAEQYENERKEEEEEKSKKAQKIGDE